MGEALVSVWLADLDGSVREARNVNQQHAAGTLGALVARVAEEAGTTPAAVLEAAGCSPMTELVVAGGERDLITAHDAARILAGIAERRLLSASAGDALEQELVGHPERDGIPLGLPEDVLVANHTGLGDGFRHEVALVRPTDRPPFVLAVLTTGLDEDEAEWRVSELARFLWETAW
ncbi:MAG TPA: serine hydrolase [Nocardioides sp.]|uniref:serine hydrolase n=1 Tax=Nocardioides sp. TaxID=35761 RepID=UPI002ED9F582